MTKRLLSWVWYALVFLLPLQTVYIFFEKTIGSPLAKWQYGAIALYGTDIVALFFLLIGAAVFFMERRGRVLEKSCRLMLMFLMTFVGIAAISVLWSSDWLVSTQSFLRLFFGVCCLLVVCTGSFSKRGTAYAWFVSACAQGVFAWWQFVVQGVYASKWFGATMHSATVLGDAVVENGVGRWLRAYGSWPHPNLLSIFLAVGLVTGCALFFSSRKYFERIVVLLGCCVITIGLLVSFGRGAWISLAASSMIAGIYLAWFKSGELKKVVWRKILLFILTLGTVVVIAGSAVFPLLQTRLAIGGHERLEVRSIEERGQSLRLAWSYILKHPILGAGIGVSTDVEFKEDVSLGIFHESYFYQPVHNLYVLIVVELGVVGGVVFLLCLVAMVGSIAKCLHRAKDSNTILWCLSASMISLTLFFSGAFDHFFWTIHGGIFMWWIGWGVAVILSRKDEAMPLT